MYSIIREIIESFGRYLTVRKNDMPIFAGGIPFKKHRTVTRKDFVQVLDVLTSGQEVKTILLII